MTLPSMRLDGLVAVVTGGGTGLGRACALAFAEAGADVAVSGPVAVPLDETARDISALGRKAIAVVADVTSVADNTRLAQTVHERFGRIDILLNNAGVVAPKAFLELGVEDVQRLINVNLIGTILCTQAVVPYIQRGSAGGRIINMASVLAQVAVPQRSVYAATKGAIVQLTRSLAVELGASDITANAIGPGAVETEINRELMKSQPELYAPLRSRISLGRMCQPTDVAALATFLASPAAAFISGQVIYVDGGYTVHG